MNYTISKIRSTHITFSKLAGYTIHVEGDREWVKTLIGNALTYADGVDLTILVKRHRSGPYYRTKVWVAQGIVNTAMITDSHLVDVTNEPYGEMDENENRPWEQGTEPVTTPENTPTENDLVITL